MQLFLRALQHQTEPRRLESSRIAWSNLDWQVRVPVKDSIEFQLWWLRPLGQDFLAPWLRLHIALQTTERSATISLPYGELRIQYQMQRKYDVAHSTMIMTGRIASMELGFSFGPEAFWNAFAMMERHRLTARIRVGPPTQTPLAQPYLGRAQSVQTMEFARRRIYKWLPRPVEEADSLSPRESQEWESHAREAKELRRISGRGILAYGTPREEKVVEEEMDNDAWSNKRRVLPVRLRAQDGGLKVVIFNLGASTDGDVPYAESCYLRWESFAGALAVGRLDTDLTPHLKLSVHFERTEDDNTIQITQLGLDVRDYSQMLRHMGRCQGAKTI